MTDIDIFGALSNPIRRRFLALLRVGPRSVNELTHGLEVTQPAVLQHLGVLRAVLLLQVERKGNQRIYHLDSQGLAAFRQYVDSFWDRALDSYQQ